MAVYLFIRAATMCLDNTLLDQEREPSYKLDCLIYWSEGLPPLGSEI